MTERLFFTDDALTAEVDVISCTPHEDGFAVVLNATPSIPRAAGSLAIQAGLQTVKW
jgi:hypothetical protein